MRTAIFSVDKLLTAEQFAYIQRTAWIDVVRPLGRFTERATHCMTLATFEHLDEIVGIVHKVEKCGTLDEDHYLVGVADVKRTQVVYEGTSANLAHDLFWRAIRLNAGALCLI